MKESDQTICLSMIVRNEAPVIARCLDSVRPFIDHWVIVDTGSTDGTQDIIRAQLKDIQGTLYERPWRDFAYNRSEALRLARNQAHYTLIIDADDTLETASEFNFPLLEAGSYAIEIRDKTMVYVRPQLVDNKIAWRYEGILHEFLTSEGSFEVGHLTGLWIRRNHDGARRRDPSTYKRDAVLLEEALTQESSPFLRSRYTFYLAQSYRDAGEKLKALEMYKERANLGFWQEEVFVSLYNAAKIKEDLQHPDQEVLEMYRRASDAVPTRAEALHGASRFCRKRGLSAEGFSLAQRARNIPAPGEALFLERWIYDYGILDELAVNAYWCGQYRESLSASLILLANTNCPSDHRERFAKNAASALQHVTDDASLGSAAAESPIAQHAMVTPRPLKSRLIRIPRVLIAILAKQKESALTLYLECIEALNYPKSSIFLYIRTNNNTDGTQAILEAWIRRVGHLYGKVEFDAENVDAQVQQFGVHEWNAIRFRVLGHIRNISLRRALAHECDFYFVADVDNFVRPSTLRELVALDLPIVGPFLRSIDPKQLYSNYHAEIDSNGYYKEVNQYRWILNRWIRGVVEVPVVHCTYLVRTDVVPALTYEDGTDRFEYVIFSDSARKSSIPQYIDNRQLYGYISFDESSNLYTESGVETARRLLEDDLHPKSQQESPRVNGNSFSNCEARSD